jgi:hypothetical protein
MATEKYPDDCCHREGGLECKMFKMTCAMFHAMTGGYYAGQCLYYNRHLDCIEYKKEN